MNNLEVLFDNIRLILESEDDEFFKKANNQLLANFEETLVGQDSKKMLDNILIKGDEQGYTQEQYVNEIVATGEILNESCQELFKEYENYPYKFEFCKGFQVLLNNFILTAIEYINNRKVFNIAVELCHPNAKLPTYAHDTDWGADVYAVEDMTIQPGSYGVMVPTGLRVAIPHGWMISFRPRSGMSHKTPLRLSNSPGTIDETNRGELKVLFDNISKIPVEIKAGERIAQMGLEKNYKAHYHVVDNVERNTDRGEGGFGSSGN